jgi:hypothetical protein
VGVKTTPIGHQESHALDILREAGVEGVTGLVLLRAGVMQPGDVVERLRLKGHSIGETAAPNVLATRYRLWAEVQELDGESAGAGTL